MQIHRSLPDVSRVLAYDIFVGNMGPGAGAPVFKHNNEYWLMAPDVAEDFPAFPESVQYQGTQQQGSRPWQHVDWGWDAPSGRYGGFVFTGMWSFPLSNYDSPPSDEHRRALRPDRPGYNRPRVSDPRRYEGLARRDLQYAMHKAAVFFTSTDYDARPYASDHAHRKLAVAMPVPQVEPYDFSKGQWSSADGNAGHSPPGFPLSLYNFCLLCFQIMAGLPFFWAVGWCTAGFTAHFTTGNLGQFLQGSSGVWAIDDVTAFGYSGGTAISNRRSLNRQNYTYRTPRAVMPASQVCPVEGLS